MHPSQCGAQPPGRSAESESGSRAPAELRLTAARPGGRLPMVSAAQSNRIRLRSTTARPLPPARTRPHARSHLRARGGGGCARKSAPLATVRRKSTRALATEALDSSGGLQERRGGAGRGVGLARLWRVGRGGDAQVTWGAENESSRARSQPGVWRDPRRLGSRPAVRSH